MKLNNFKLKLKGKTAVYVDWANVYGWTKSLKREINPQKLYNYLKDYKNEGFLKMSPRFPEGRDWIHYIT